MGRADGGGGDAAEEAVAERAEAVEAGGPVLRAHEPVRSRLCRYAEVSKSRRIYLGDIDEPSIVGTV